MRWLVTGASRGIGRALVEMVADRGDEVIAAVRDPAAFGASGSIMVVALDVTDVGSVRRARETLPCDALDVVVSNAGLSGGPQRAPGMDLGRAARIIATNALGPLHVYDAFVDLLRRGEAKKLVHVSSEAASLGHFRASSKPEYAMSKAALNALTRWVAAVEPELVCASIDPGWTRTGTGGADAPCSPEDSARALVRAIDGLTKAHSGSFLDVKLAPIAW